MTTSAATFDREAMREIVRDEIDLLRSELREHYATKADLSDLKADMKGTLIQVVIGLAGLQLLGLAAVAAIIRFLG